MNTSEIFDRLMELRRRIEADTEEPLLGSDNALLYDVAKTLGLSEEQAAQVAGDDAGSPPADNGYHDEDVELGPFLGFDRSGLGIGGAGRHSLEDETLDLIARGRMKVIERERKGPMPSGQLWQPCARRGCDIEPVCLDCERCYRHCYC
jgi:hypothetical protein